VAHNNIISYRLLNLVPKYELEALVNRHQLRTISRWPQLIVTLIDQPAVHVRLREIIDNIFAQSHRNYHIDPANIFRSNLSRKNSDKPYQLYEAFFSVILNRCQSAWPEHNFHFKNSMHSLDVTTIKYCSSDFLWLGFRSARAAIKSHVGFSRPSLVYVSHGAL